MTSTLDTKAAALEGLDFIETEEDVKAVEAATLKIQSTFRGKKIRSKIATAPKPSGDAQQETDDKRPAARSGAGQSTQDSAVAERAGKEAAASKRDELALSAKVAEMQVQDKDNGGERAAGQQPRPATNTAEDEAARAATKIQAGFKGYKTRKELEGKLPSASAAGQQEAPAAAPDNGPAPSS